MRPRARGGSVFFSISDRGIRLYPEDRLYEEVGFIAYYFHWSHDEIMNMEHRERRRWCEEISRINRKINDEPNRPSPFDVFNKR